ncbi:LysE family translocator [Chitinophaga pendula]|uniref:LysE family translocator n=1 Tax=Chitinophaga TaxID=79328 RepID=UPI000BAEBEB9|nr:MULTISPECIES: LysE family translocator [Chitinophaga]ASZ10338.1 homoserine lactone transporter [Chitinophaga sp. MD30]UCJ06700.1 LysE family translocator [Chitinophaga pendula]
MLGIDNFGAFLLAGILLNITPGADTMYILARSISQGKKAGISSVLGISTGIIFHTLAATFGLSLIIARSALAFSIVKYAGAVYLVYLGVRTLTKGADLHTATLPGNAPSGHKIFWSGVLTNVLNPKVALFFLAFLPQFIDKAHIQSPIPYLVLGLCFVITSVLWFLVIVWCAAAMSAQLKYNVRVKQWLNRISGSVFILLGVKLALTRK